MGKFDFGAAAKQAEKDGHLGGGGYLRLKEGGNRMRIVSEFIPHPGEYQGRRNFKWLGYVIDRADGAIKPFFMPHSISKMIANLQRSDDWGFESVPMPYDITIQAKGAGTIEVEYTVIPSPKQTPITGDEQVAIDAAKPLHDVQASIYEKVGRPEDKSAHVPGFDPDEIPT